MSTEPTNPPQRPDVAALVARLEEARRAYHDAGQALRDAIDLARRLRATAEEAAAEFHAVREELLRLRQEGRCSATLSPDETV